MVVSGEDLFLEGYADHRDLHSFPTRRSSDLCRCPAPPPTAGRPPPRSPPPASSTSAATPRQASTAGPGPLPRRRRPGDRKSTRLNSSHANISYAVFCLKKNNDPNPTPTFSPL